jgi:DNA repair protein RecO (recombination protein O)
MYSSTRGIVFRQTRYSDTSLVVRILTEELGLRSYLVKGARNPRSKMRSSLFQPLTLLELVVSERDKGELHHIKEARVEHAFQTIPGDINKSSVLLFLNELLYKSIREESANRELFRYIHEQLFFLDSPGTITGSYPLLFAIHLSHYLGFFPQGDPAPAGSVFDLQEGRFTRSGQLFSEYLITGEACGYFATMLHVPPGKHREITLPSPVRQELIEKLLQYYHLHLPISGAFKSHIVLHEVLKK